MRSTAASLSVLFLLIACGGEEPEGETQARADDAGSRTEPLEGGSVEDAGVKGMDAEARDAAADAGQTFTGEATYYDLTGQNACGRAEGGEVLIAALNKTQYTRSWCGACARVVGPNGSVVVRILDLCPGCKNQSLDLSRQAFQRISPLSAGRIRITWNVVPCP